MHHLHEVFAVVSQFVYQILIRKIFLSLQTIVCVPTKDGVVELGSTDLVSLEKYPSEFIVLETSFAQYEDQIVCRRTSSKSSNFLFEVSPDGSWIMMFKGSLLYYICSTC